MVGYRAKSVLPGAGRIKRPFCCVSSIPLNAGCAKTPQEASEKSKPIPSTFADDRVRASPERTAAMIAAHSSFGV